MADATTEMVPCACTDCVCKVKAGTGIERDGKTFCCEACADGHASHDGCGHSGCACHG
ncbi:metallothionein [Methylobacterium gossipiicola]|uniref:Metallothionein n=1 Tax=Methylobacterium gossipiicola TaxID=582675 RepID=A0A1I2SBI0_9HYPH|nr:metallothionein [Methylobacterium gossipiicola]SFG48257.1 metallothionein [Methylobacterium gossipiicola]